MASPSPWSSISSSASCDPVPSDSTSAPDSAPWWCPTGCDSELRLLVALVALNVLRRCDTGRSQPRDVLVSHAKRLVALTLGGLLLPNGCVLPGSRGHQHRSVGSMCRAILRDLRRDVCSNRSLLLSMILLQDPAVDTAFVRALHAHLMIGNGGHKQGDDSTKSSRLSLHSVRTLLDDFLESMSLTLATLFM